jgi:hypothetical protein
MHRHLRKPSPAMIVALISLFVALGGTSFAAVTLTRNSVLSKHIKNGQVKRADLGANAVSSAKVLDASLLAQDFAAGQLPKGEKGDTGARGDTGPQGPAGSTAGFPGTASAEDDPSSTPDLTIATEVVSLPRSGRLLVLGRFTRSSSCDMSSLNVLYGLYADDTPIPGSGLHMLKGGAMAPMTLVGITDPLSAGNHSLQIKSDCTEGGIGSTSSFADESISAVLLG